MLYAYQSHLLESNLRPTDYKSVALPAELRWLMSVSYISVNPVISEETMLQVNNTIYVIKPNINKNFNPQYSLQEFLGRQR